MNLVRLTEKVTLEAPDFWGRKARIIFHPSKLKGWWWKYNRNKDNFVKIGPKIVNSKSERVRLKYKKSKLEIFEHIGILRWFGLCDLVIESTPWPPYFGRAFEYWETIRPYCQIDQSREVDWYDLIRPVEYVLPEQRANRDAFTKIYPGRQKSLKIEVTINYPILGGHFMQFSFPDNGLLEKISKARTQGWPMSLYLLSKSASFFGWPHHDSIIWINREGRKKSIFEFINHRVADILGSLSLACGDGLISGRVVSVCSGHRADIGVITKMDNSIERRNE